METNKYYTPQIEEFHVGFEFESNYLKSYWKKEILDLDTSSYWYDAYQNDATSSEFRVKLLDREDIEACGWVCKRIQGRYNPNFAFKKDIYYLYFNEVSETENIIISPNTSGDVFKGQIKNISELRRVMKMTKIV